MKDGLESGQCICTFFQPQHLGSQQWENSFNGVVSLGYGRDDWVYIVHPHSHLATSLPSSSTHSHSHHTLTSSSQTDRPQTKTHQIPGSRCLDDRNRFAPSATGLLRAAGALTLRGKWSSRTRQPLAPRAGTCLASASAAMTRLTRLTSECIDLPRLIIPWLLVVEPGSPRA